MTLLNSLIIVDSTELVILNRNIGIINLSEYILTVSIHSNSVLLSIETRTEGCTYSLNTISVIEGLTVEDMAQSRMRVEVFLSLTPVGLNQRIKCSTGSPAVVISSYSMCLVRSVLNSNSRTNNRLNILCDTDRQISVVNHLVLSLVNQLHANNGNTVDNNVSSLSSVIRTTIQTTHLRILRMQEVVTSSLILIDSSVCRLVGLAITELHRSQLELIFEVTIEIVTTKYIVNIAGVGVVSLNQRVQVDILLIVDEIPTFTLITRVIATVSLRDVLLTLVDRLEEVYATLAEVVGATNVLRQVATAAVLVQHTSLRQLIRSNIHVVGNVSNLQILHSLLNDSCIVRSNNNSLVLVILIGNLSSEYSYTRIFRKSRTIGGDSANLLLYLQRHIQHTILN